MLLLQCYIVNGIQVNRVSGSLIEYPFTHSDCLARSYLDVTRSSNAFIGSIIPITNSSCSSYNALSVKASSKKNITTVLPQLKAAPYITIEFWVGIDVADIISDNIVEVLSIGKIDGTSYNIKVVVLWCLLSRSYNNSIDIV